MTETFTEVDVEAVAHRVLRDPRRARVSTIEQAALAGWIVSRLDAVAISPGLGAALVEFIASEATLKAAEDAFGTGDEAADLGLAALRARASAFNALKIHFEQEFKTWTA